MDESAKALTPAPGCKRTFLQVFRQFRNEPGWLTDFILENTQFEFISSKIFERCHFAQNLNAVVEMLSKFHFDPFTVGYDRLSIRPSVRPSTILQFVRLSFRLSFCSSFSSPLLP